jgi:hypothetical protein
MLTALSEDSVWLSDGNAPEPRIGFIPPYGAGSGGIQGPR